MSGDKDMVLSPLEDQENSRAVIAHTIPFALWLTAMQFFDDDYLIRTIVGGGSLLILRPWRWYARFQWKNLLPAIAVGLGIFVLWVGFESPIVEAHAPTVVDWYQRLFVDYMHPFKVRELFESAGGKMLPYELGENGLHVYDPKTTGWTLFWVHMFGTTVCIAVIEEMLYRGFLYRWMMGSPFYRVDAGKMNWKLLIVISLFFAMTHIEWMAAILCGIAYGWLYIKTRDIWASVVAHGVTNFLLGIYVIRFDAYQFW